MEDTRFNENKFLFPTIHEADRVVLYEGLPHQMLEFKQLEEERRSKAIVMLHGFAFYQETLDLQEEDKRKLLALLGNAESFAPWIEEKKCDGFHPDYCVEWAVQDEIYRCSICFGCSEVKVYGPKDQLYCDIQRRAYEQLSQLLQKYRKNRPPVRFD